MPDSAPPRLGFSVDTLLPRARGGGVLKMGLVRLDECEWLQPNPARALRAAAFAAHPDAVQVLPEAEPAGAELAAMLGVAGGLAGAARSYWEDMCLLTRREGEAAHRLTGGAVAFPTDWRLHDKIGLPLTEVHKPIHGYREQLSAGVDNFMNGLAPHTIYGRANWFVVASDALRYLPEDPPQERFAHVTAANAGETLIVRSERQTLRRLPETGAIVFTIGVYLAPLGSLSDENVARLAAAVEGVSAGESERRSAPHYAEALRAYAQSRHPSSAGSVS